MIEIERKFVVDANFVDKLKSFNEYSVIRESTQILEDVYYDTAEKTLALSDVWLRKRNERWEIKFEGATTLCDDKITQYRESDDEQKILDILSNYGVVLDYGCRKSTNTIQKLIEERVLTIFAAIRATRQSYDLRRHLPESGKIINLNIVIDTTEGGDIVAEVEICCDENAGVENAKLELNKFLQHFGLVNVPPPFGKLESYILRNEPQLYKRLVEKHILMPRTTGNASQK